jgi:hypothetical protein
MTAAETRCGQCGAAVNIPADLSVVQMRCSYCGYSQPVPDFVERQRALQQQQFQAATQRSVLESVQSAQKMGSNISKIVTIFVVLTLIVTLGFTAFMMTNAFGVFGN